MNKQQMCEVLRELIETGGLSARHSNGFAPGLCRLLEDGDLEPYFLSWDHYSENSYYPVPHPNGGCEEAIFDEDCSWEHRYTGPYGELRLDLARHILKQMESEL